jgi:hypothetical protein
LPVAAERIGQRLHGFDDAMRCFIEHQRMRMGNERLQMGGTLLGLRRQEAEERERADEIAGCRNGRRHRAGAGQRHDGKARLAHGVDELGAWVRHARCAGIGNVGDAFAGAQAIDDALGRLSLIVLVHGHERLRNAVEA